MDRPVVAVLLTVIVGLSGCLERHESITIAPDGAAVLRSEFKGDIDDISAGDAIPGPGGPWLVSDVPQRDDEKKMTRTAELSVLGGQPFPSTYLQTPIDPRADRVLNFPTTVKVMRAEAGKDGIARTYYDFKRTYQRRDDARYTLARRIMENDETLKALKDRDPGAMSDDERVVLVRALAKIELNKHLQFLSAGVSAVGDGWPQEIGLLVRRSLVDHMDAFDPQPFADLLARPRSEDRDAKIAQAMREFTDRAREAVMKEMDALGLSKESQAGFMAAAEAEADRRGVTEDLADEKWTVRVTLPGKVIAHNGDRVEGNTVVWEFGAERIMDMDNTLMASSRVDEKR